MTWTSANPEIATVNNGTITGVAAGTTTITAVCGKASASVAVTVTANEPIEPTDPEEPDNPDDPAEPEINLPFTDVPKGAWFYGTVADVYEKGLMTGLTDTIFGPNDKLARAQFATILWRMEDEPAVAFEQKFPDVPDSQFYTKAVLWAADAGIVTGYTDTGKFGPGDNINREQMAVMMFRYADYPWTGYQPEGGLQFLSGCCECQQLCKRCHELVRGQRDHHRRQWQAEPPGRNSQSGLCDHYQ